MNIRNYGLSMALIATVVVPWMISGCDQVTTQCQVGKATASGYAAVYKLVSTTGDCSASPLPPGETIGMDDYHPVTGETRDFTKADVYIQVGSLYDTQQFASTCYAPADPSVGYKGGPFADTNPSDTTWSKGNFKDFLPDSQDFCYVDNFTTAQQHIPAIPATKAGTNPPGTCFSPGAGCDNGDGTSNPACVCPAPKPGQPAPDDCCDTFFSYCADKDFAPCMGDSDCKPGVKCSQTPVTVCSEPDPASGFAIGCGTDGECATATGDAAAKCNVATSASFCTNATAVIGCASDDDCCDPTDAACLAGPHTCLPGGVDFTSCHTSEVPKQDIAISWSNVKFYNTASAPGTQMTASATRTTGTCEQKYDVIGVWPSVSCDGANFIGGTPGKPFAAACCPGSDAAAGIPLGSGINPNFAVKCDPTLLLCVLDVDHPLPQLDAKGYPDGCPKPATVPDGQ
jgi:hypothetical protein